MPWKPQEVIGDAPRVPGGPARRDYDEVLQEMKLYRQMYGHLARAVFKREQELLQCSAQLLHMAMELREAYRRCEETYISAGDKEPPPQG